ncbi:MAG: hypothetical protein K2O16_17250 [Lachnospiraceae bacterium]|nr:hypothetical protein [Lachnospiraceae bacterium]MDE7333931.1 hypothetical protein [Lachnospiraceae bacterium]
MKQNWFKKQVDERQEKDILWVEHYGFWFMYWMLLAILLVQGICMDGGARLAAGEWIVFVTTSIFVLVGWIRKGVWSFQAKKVPGVKNFLIYSCISTVLIGMPFGILSGIRWHKGDAGAVLVTVIVYMLIIFIISFAMFWVVGSLTRKREAFLAGQDSDGEQDLDEK